MSICIDIEYITKKAVEETKDAMLPEIASLSNEIDGLKKENAMLRSELTNEGFLINELFVEAESESSTSESSQKEEEILESNTFFKQTAEHLPPPSEASQNSENISTLSWVDEPSIRKTILNEISEPGSRNDLNEAIINNDSISLEDSNERISLPSKELEPNRTSLSFIMTKPQVISSYTLPEAVFLVDRHPGLETSDKFNQLIPRIENNENIAFSIYNDEITILFDEINKIQNNSIKIASDGSFILAHCQELEKQTVACFYSKRCKFVEIYKCGCDCVVVKAPLCFDNIAVNNKGLSAGFFESCKYIKFVEIGNGNESVKENIFVAPGVEKRNEWECE